MTEEINVSRSSSVAESLPSQDGDLTGSMVMRHAKRMKRLRPINFSLLRWNLLWLLVIWIFITLPVWLPYASRSCSATLYTIFAVQVWLNLVWFFAMIFTISSLIRLHYGMITDHKATYPADVPLIHLLILTIYKDDMSVVCRTLDSLADQSEAKRIVLVKAWE